MNDLVQSPFGAASNQVATSGTQQAQSRELAETQVRYVMAQRFPRDAVANMDRILNAFTRPTLAEKAQYQFARGGSDISGPSIRAAEAVAQQWGNLDQGFRELSRGIDAGGVPFSEVEAYCTDLESRSSKRLQFIVKHWRDTKSGGYKLKDERDIYELIANQAQRRVRACILAMVPGDVIDAAMEQANTTLHAKADTSQEAMQKMVEAFGPFGVTKGHIEKRIQRRLEAIQPAQVVTLKRIYASLRDEMSAAADWFEIEPEAAPNSAIDAVKAATQSKPAKKETNSTKTPQQYIEEIDSAPNKAAAEAIKAEAFKVLPPAEFSKVQQAFNMAFED